MASNSVRSVNRLILSALVIWQCIVIMVGIVVLLPTAFSEVYLLSARPGKLMLLWGWGSPTEGLNEEKAVLLRWYCSGKRERGSKEGNTLWTRPTNSRLQLLCSYILLTLISPGLKKLTEQGASHHNNGKTGLHLYCKIQPVVWVDKHSCSRLYSFLSE